METKSIPRSPAIRPVTSTAVPRLRGACTSQGRRRRARRRPRPRCHRHEGHGGGRDGREARDKQGTGRHGAKLWAFYKDLRYLRYLRYVEATLFEPTSIATQFSDGDWLKGFGSLQISGGRGSVALRSPSSWARSIQVFHIKL